MVEAFFLFCNSSASFSLKARISVLGFVGHPVSTAPLLSSAVETWEQTQAVVNEAPVKLYLQKHGGLGFAPGSQLLTLIPKFNLCKTIIFDLHFFSVFELCSSFKAKQRVFMYECVYLCNLKLYILLSWKERDSWSLSSFQYGVTITEEAYFLFFGCAISQFPCLVIQCHSSRVPT